MLKKYSGIISVLAVVVAVILVIGGIAAAINLESFLPVLYFGIGAAIYYIFMHSYALLLETTANNEDALAAIRQFLQKLDTQAPTKRSATPYVSIATSHVTTPAQSQHPAAKAPDKPAESAAVTVASARIICPKCGREQPANRRRCFDCGIEFIKQESRYADPKNPHILICPNCGARQSDTNTACYQCHTSLL